MGRPVSTGPTTAEIRILLILAQCRGGTGTVRDIKDRIPGLAYTSLATIMRIMVDKNMVEIVDARRPQRFRHLGSVESITSAYLKSVVDYVFDGNTGRLLDAIKQFNPKAYSDMLKREKAHAARSKIQS